MAIIGIGFDLFTVVKRSTSFQLDPLFPGVGTIHSDGVRIDPETHGNFTTGLKRKEELPDNESGAISIAWFAEHSISVNPVKLAPFGLGDGEADFHTIINLGGVLPRLPNTDGLVRPSDGVMMIKRSLPGGGRFDLALNGTMRVRGRISSFALAVALSLPALVPLPVGAQNARPYGNCPVANGAGPGSTNFYSRGNPCAYMYNVPADQANAMMRNEPQCQMISRTQFACSGPIRGNYGQLRTNGPAGTAPASSYSTHPSDASAPGAVSCSPSLPRGVAGQDTASAESFWERGAQLDNEQRYSDAVPVLYRAARLGHARAQAVLGIIYQDGDGVREDDRAAACWFSLAAAQGHRASQYALGGMYEEGEGGLPRDQQRANELYLASANKGFDKAQLAIGMSYEFGEGVGRNRAKAIDFIGQAAAQGEEHAVFLLPWLKNPTLPAFSTPAQMGQYIADRTARYYQAHASSGGGGNRPVSGMAQVNAANEFSHWMAQRGAGNGGN